ncbi:MAG TPA: TIGR01777 family oxidoreductase [Cerasibacillus sp.]|uniref:TIGR01777 family oxidoreductase n=1 Tax=Cerasibacillus sp. TaxID=2498711 RepID=UPI002F423C1A
MNILLTGGTGFIGTQLMKHLHKEEHHTYVLTRTPYQYHNHSLATYLSYEDAIQQLPKIDVMINLAGESLFGYWTKKKQEKILNSRIETTEWLIELIKQLDEPPKLLINGSAVGYYGTSNDHMFTENTTESGNDFLADVVKEWEQTAQQAEALGIRTVLARFGIVLGNEGALPLMVLPVKFGVGGNIGKGQQWISWIHIDDAARLILHIINNEDIRGPINVTAPNPVRHKDFMKKLADVLKRPYWLHTPAFLFRAATGKMSFLILEGQYVLPKKAMEHHFQFSYPHLEETLYDVLKK